MYTSTPEVKRELPDEKIKEAMKSFKDWIKEGINVDELVTIGEVSPGLTMDYDTSMCRTFLLRKSFAIVPEEGEKRHTEYWLEFRIHALSRWIPVKEEDEKA